MPIWKQRLFARLHAPQGGEGGEGGGGEGGSADDVQAKISAAVEAAVAGLKAKNSELLGSLKDAKEQLRQFDGIDPGAVRDILKRFADDEEAGLIKAGKIDEVLNKRTERMKADYEKKLTDAVKAAEAATKRAQAFQGRVLDDSIRAAAAKAGLHQHAIDDALFRARSMFALDENGQAVQFGDDGNPVLGKDGKSPFTPLEWLEGMKDKAPHWFPASASGSGAGSGGGGGGSGSTKGNWTGSEAERIAAVKAKFPDLK
jgi:hypothetical protein